MMKNLGEEKEKLDAIINLRVCREDRIKYKANFVSVQDWLEAIDCESSTIPKADSSTEYHYLGYLIKFCLWLAKNPDEIIAERLEDLKSSDVRVRKRYERLVRKFSLGYKRQEKPVAAREAVVALKSFFKHNSAPLHLKSPRKVIEKVRERLTMEEIKKMLKFCDIRERAILLLLLQSGMQPHILLSLTYGDVKDDLESGTLPIRIYIPAARAKGGYAPFTLFIGRDAAEALRDYLEYRRRGFRKIKRETVTESSPLIRKIYSPTSIGYGLLYKVIRKLREAAGINRNITPYTFRRTFQTLMEAHMPVNWIDRLMGHVKFRGLQGQAYSQPTMVELMEAYKEAEPFISVSETAPTTNEKCAKMEVLRGIAKLCGVDLDQVLEKRKIKSLDEMTDEEVETLYEEYRRALHVLGQSSCQEETENSSSTEGAKDCGSSSVNHVCPNCNSIGWKENDKFCGICGTSLATKCPKCGKENDKKHKFCTKCGANLDE